jgi:DNA-binding response OmpR family regulator
MVTVPHISARERGDGLLRSSEDPAMQSPSPRFILLCIDDNAAELKLRTLILANAGYAVFTATTGEAGLHLFTHNHVDLVISDHVLQDVPGAQLIDEMKRLKPDVPFLMLSGLPDAPEGAERADMFVTKGMSPPDFLAAIQKLLKGKAATSANTRR